MRIKSRTGRRNAMITSPGRNLFESHSDCKTVNGHDTSYHPSFLEESIWRQSKFKKKFSLKQNSCELFKSTRANRGPTSRMPKNEVIWCTKIVDWWNSMSEVPFHETAISQNQEMRQREGSMTPGTKKCNRIPYSVTWTTNAASHPYYREERG